MGGEGGLGLREGAIASAAPSAEGQTYLFLEQELGGPRTVADGRRKGVAVELKVTLHPEANWEARPGANSERPGALPPQADRGDFTGKPYF